MDNLIQALSLCTELGLGETIRWFAGRLGRKLALAPTPLGRREKALAVTARRRYGWVGAYSRETVED